MSVLAVNSFAVNALADDDSALPRLRDELRLEAAPAGADGAPRWRIHDPLRHRFFLLGDADVKLMSLWGGGSVGALRAALASAKAVLDERQLAGLLEFLRSNHLVQPEPGGAAGSATRRLREAAARQQATGWRWLLQRYMGMRIALWHPQAFLDRTLPLLHGLLSRPVGVAWALATALGLYLVTRQWDQFTGTFGEFFTPGGVLAYGSALLLLKAVHELGHAYAATHHGCKVGAMGVSVAMGVPMLYTETTDAARLPEARQRMWIAAAGVLAETVVAGLATLAWAVLPDGTPRSIAFVLATSSWLMSLLINLNPFSRFDGYYFLSDALRIENLQPRALAMAGWAVGRGLFGAIEASPEALPRRRALGFALFGSGVWLYRMGLYFGAAALAYACLFKAAGLAAGALLLWLFVARPMCRQGGRWWAARGHMTQRRRLGLLGFGAALVALLALPLDRSVSVPAMLGWQHETVLQAPENARVLEVLVHAGQTVQAGQLLLRLEAPELRIKQAEARIRELAAGERLDRISGDQQDRAESTVLAQQRREAVADLQGLADRRALLELRAPEAGVVADLPQHLQPGRWVRPELTLLRLLHGSTLDARGFVAERDLPRLEVGAAGRFVADDPALRSLPLALTELEAVAAEQITPAALASPHGGAIATRADAKGRDVPVLAQHRVRFSVAQQQSLDPALNPARKLSISSRGVIRVDAQPQSLLGQASRQLWRLTMAELRD